jgi:hypothetical protein
MFAKVPDAPIDVGTVVFCENTISRGALPKSATSSGVPKIDEDVVDGNELNTVQDHGRDDLDKLYAI